MTTTFYGKGVAVAGMKTACGAVLIASQFTDIVEWSSGASGNPRYKKLTKATEAAISKDPGMAAALAAAKNALAGGKDLSNGAYFWDGADIKSNYKNHFKVKHGIKFMDPSHNIYDIKESTDLVIVNKTIVKKKKGVVISTTTVEVGGYDHIYESTAAYGSTIFWKQNAEYMEVTHAKEYK